MLFSYASVNSICAQPPPLPLPPGPLRGICPPCQSRGWGICKKRQKGKKVAVLTKNGAFALFFRPHPGGFDSSRVPTPGNLPSKVKKNANARGSARRGGGGMGAGGIDLCITEERKWKGKESGLLLYNVSVKRSTSRKARCIPFLLKISKWLA